MSSYITGLLATNVAPAVTARLQAELRKFIVGGIVRGYLPQAWWIVSNSGAGTLYVDNNGNAVAYDGQVETPDGTITWTDEGYYAAVVLQDRSRIPPSAGQPQAVAHTGKGQAALGQIRKMIGV